MGDAGGAERVYNGEWRERVEKLYGAKPSITWFDSPVIVDNLAGGIDHQGGVTGHRINKRKICRTTHRAESPMLAAAAGSAALPESLRRGEHKGPLVWLDMDQQELDDAYDQSVYAPNREQIVKRRDRQQRAVRARLGAPERCAYGPTAIERARHLPDQAPPTRRSTSSSMAAPGAAALAKTTPSRPSCSSTPARISSCSTSSTSTRPAAT